MKIQSYKEDGKSLTNFDLNNCLLSLKAKYPELKKIHSQILQDVSKRVSLAFQHFFRRVKSKEKPGFPRFKCKNRYHSLTFPQSGFCLDEKLTISKIGEISIVKHRHVKGKIKTMTIKKSSSNKWHAYFCVEYEPQKKVKVNFNVLGIDLGLHHFYADSDGNIVNNPRYLRNSEEKLSHLQKFHSRKKKGSRNKQRLRLKVALLYEKILNQRNDFLHKQTRMLANLYSIIAVEKLSIKNMIHNKYLSKSISDAGWYKFLQILAYKVEETGGKILKVSARGTSQYCICGNKAKKTLAVRVHKCDKCGIEIDRDIMSAIIIKFTALNGATAGSAVSNALGDERLLSSMNQELSLHSI